MKTAGDLADYFASLDPKTEVMIRDGFNGGGVPREINSGPRFYIITEADAEETADCEDKVGCQVVVIGFGSY